MESDASANVARLAKYSNENDRLLDEVSNLRLQIQEMKNDRIELVRAHRESMSLLAKVSEEKLEEYRNRSEVEAAEGSAAREEALRTVLEMMEKDCEERVAELDARLAVVELEREQAVEMQIEAATRAEEEGRTKEDMEEACRMAVQRLVREREARSLEREEREREMRRELAEMQRAVIEAARSAGEGRGQSGDGSYDGGSYSSRGSASAGSSRDREFEDHEPSIPVNVAKRPPVVHRPGPSAESVFLYDTHSTMTNGRKIALLLENSSLYRPCSGKFWDNNGSGLRTAWAHFEHSVLPRYIVRNADGSMSRRKSHNGAVDDIDESGRISVYESSVNGSTIADESNRRANDDQSDIDDWLDRPKVKKEKKQSSSRNDWRKPPQTDIPSQRKMKHLSRASPGESHYTTRLYSPFFTPLSQMGDFGIGVGLYFSSLRGVALITLVAGLINLPNIMYFASEEYSKGQVGVSIFLRGSAICTEQLWVPCPTCVMEDFRTAPERIAGATTVTPDGDLQTMVFALKNTCDGATMNVGIYNLASLGWILLSLIALALYQKRKQIQFDEQEQTAQDYSIEIKNPPGDATEPEEWRDFFESRFGGHLTCCTVTINNDLLVKALAERREILAVLELKIREGSSIEVMRLSELAARVEHRRRFFGNLKSRLAPGIPELVGRLTVLNAKIQGLAQQNYHATRVFCTFETESMQRQVLSEMVLGSMSAYRNSTHVIDPSLLFRDEHVLLVREAEEPNTIRWTDLDEKTSARIKQITITTFVGLACIAAVAVIVTLCHRNISHIASALAISISNSLFPIVAKILTNFEAHSSETGKQNSLYTKIAIFRWVITAIVITLITPFTATLGNGPDYLIESIFTIFFFDLVTGNALQLLDPMSNFKRHYLAPRAPSQNHMNLLMGGTEYTIAERYTNTTKTLFLTFYYCAIYPSAYLVCAVTLFVNFYVDKFSLMRTWKPSPMLGPSISNFSRTYFMSTTIVALAVMSSYFFTGFPYDNLCSEDVSHSAFYGTWQVTNAIGHTSTAVIYSGERSYQFCHQIFFPGYGNQLSGPKWMTADQEHLSQIYGFVSMSVVSVVGAIFLRHSLKALQDLFRVSYKPVGKDQGVPFSQNENISSYVPQALSEHFTHPLLAVKIDDIGSNLFDWIDPERSHSFYDLTRDAEQLLGGDEELCYRAFSRIRHWPPGVEIHEEGGMGTKSALKKFKDTGQKQNVSWSSKVTCKTYSKDDANHWDSFDANASSTKMNFESHEPIYDPHAQDEARTFKESSSDGSSPSRDVVQPPQSHRNDPHQYQNGSHDQGPYHHTPAQQFDPYYDTGLDYEHQLPDQMYGNSQEQHVNQYDDGGSWEGSEDQSHNHSSGAGSSQSRSDSDSHNYHQERQPDFR